MSGLPSHRMPWFARRLAVGVAAMVLLLLVSATAVAQAPPGRDSKPAFPQLPDKSDDATGLVFITHGWMGAAANWANDAKTKIEAQLTADGNAAKWDVVSFDWSVWADRDPLMGNKKIGPSKASVNARNIGAEVGAKIKTEGYDEVHFITHSAGSWMIDKAADQLKATDTTIHSTFLDAYVPFPDIKQDIPILPAGESIGDTATFAEQYVDSREASKKGALSGLTNRTLPEVYNLEVTDLEMPASKGFPNHHAWPHKWYRQTIADPAPAIGHGWGYARTQEEGNLPSHDDFKRGERVKLGGGAPGPDEQGAANFEGPFDFTVANNTTFGNVTIGNGGDPGAVLLETASPVWISSEFNASIEINALLFEFEFQSLSPAEGWMSVWIDDELVFEADELFSEQGVIGETLLLDELISPGTHTLGLRIDPFSASTSTLEISNVWLGNFAIIPEPSSFVLMGLAAGFGGAWLVRNRRLRRAANA